MQGFYYFFVLEITENKKYQIHIIQVYLISIIINIFIWKLITKNFQFLMNTKRMNNFNISVFGPNLNHGKWIFLYNIKTKFTFFVVKKNFHFSVVSKKSYKYLAKQKRILACTYCWLLTLLWYKSTYDLGNGQWSELSGHTGKKPTI